VKNYLKMKVVLPLLLLGVVALAGAQQTDRPTCPNIECPDSKPEGGMFAKDDCSAEFCSCSYGVPYLLTCEEPLVFNEESQVCDWCYDMCDKCKECDFCDK